jgi:hypothetical protein
VSRQTVSEWLHHHAGFQAALNQRRQELWEGIIDTLRGLVPRALVVLQQELDGEGPGRLQAATHVLKAVGLYGQLHAPSGPTTTEDVEQAQRRQALARMQAQLTEDDVRIAEQRRSYDRLLAGLASGPLPGPPV